MRLDDLFHNREARTLSALLFWVGYEFFANFIEKIRRNARASILYPAIGQVHHLARAYCAVI
jgi:hypothetical protein